MPSPLLFWRAAAICRSVEGDLRSFALQSNQHAWHTSWRAHCACDEFNLLYSAVPSSIGCGCVSVAHTCAGWPTHSRACLFRSSVDGITQRGSARDAGQCACVFDRCNSNNFMSSAACNTPQATCYYLEVCHHALRPSIHHPRKRAPVSALTRFVHHTVGCHLPAAIMPTNLSAPPDYRSARCKASFGPVQFSSSSSPAATAVAAAAGQFNGAMAQCRSVRCRSR